MDGVEIEGRSERASDPVGEVLGPDGVPPFIGSDALRLRLEASIPLGSVLALFPAAGRTGLLGCADTFNTYKEV